ncbi:transcriptional regulator, GntR family [Quadrisphaera granulorum]|uniref:GntR family transcriptional regulator n=1 Tax=Quadrisphaera granulorum TaxID=317664 RepID=A0A316A9Q2_9ACTN|nr:GntR family transcriptional regulator [Quadrisphaera granulorum]SZE96371.1 transcriptional regulator, GntR family [Quadrisphaera granulorum]
MPWLGAGAAYTAVADGVRGLALDGRLPVGARVPSERALAAALGVSRTTVSAAYDVLRSEGYLRSAHGAGSRVSLPTGSSPVERPDVEPGGEREPEGVLDLTMAALPAPAAVLDAVAAASADLPLQLAHHGMHAFGLPVLRDAVATHLTGRGLATRPEQVLITSGALQGWNLLLRALARPGQRALVEQPTYPAVVDAVRAHHVRPVALPIGESGWELPASPAGRRAMAQAVLAHVTPDAQNPTGMVQDDDARAELLAALTSGAGAAGGPGSSGAGPVVAVDETFADLVAPGEAQTPLAALAETRRRLSGDEVVTLGSVSKSFWAGLRLGWVRASPELVSRLAQVRAGLDITSPVLDQLVAVHLLARAPEVLAERRALLAERRTGMLAALAAGVPDWTVRPAQAGLVLWVGLPTPSATQLVTHALDLGVRLVPGPRFTVDGTGDRWIRVPLTVPAEDAPALVAVLREARARALASAPTSRTPARWTA